MKNIVIILIIVILATLLFLRKRNQSKSIGNQPINTLNLQRSTCDKTKCPSQLCGVIHENSNVGKDSEDCCPEGTLSTIDRGMRRFCYGLDDGKDCFEDGMCKSNYCDIINKSKGTGICKVKYCNEDTACSNNACGFMKVGDESKVCCYQTKYGPGKNIRSSGDYYCTNMPEESVCYNNEMCAPGFVCVGSSLFSDGVCKKIT